MNKIKVTNVIYENEKKVLITYYVDNEETRKKIFIEQNGSDIEFNIRLETFRIVKLSQESEQYIYLIENILQESISYSLNMIKAYKEIGSDLEEKEKIKLSLLKKLKTLTENISKNTMKKETENPIEKLKNYFNKRYSLNNIDVIDLLPVIEQEQSLKMTTETLQTFNQLKSGLSNKSALYQLLDIITEDKFYKNKNESAHFAPLFLFVDGYNKINVADMNYYKAMYITFLNSSKTNEQLPNMDSFNQLLEFCAGKINY
jgi:hypothetical protein